MLVSEHKGVVVFVVFSQFTRKTDDGLPRPSSVRLKQQPARHNQHESTAVSFRFIEFSRWKQRRLSSFSLSVAASAVQPLFRSLLGFFSARQRASLPKP
jgi:hypothetical protein